MAITIEHIAITEPQSGVSCEVALHCAGDKGKSPVVCVHGLTRNAKDFYPLAEALAEDFYILMPDVPGRGESANLPHSAMYNNGFYSIVIAQLLDKHQLGQVRWIGTSMGGLIGMILAATRKDLIGSILINDIGHIIPKKALAYIKTYVGVNMENENYEALAEQVAENLKPFAIPSEFQEHFISSSIKKKEQGGYRLNYDPAIRDEVMNIPDEDADVSDIWKLISCPMLIFRGTESSLLTKSITEQMLASKEHIELFEVLGAGHAPSLTTPEEIAKIKEWLK